MDKKLITTTTKRIFAAAVCGCMAAMPLQAYQNDDSVEMKWNGNELELKMNLRPLDQGIGRNHRLVITPVVSWGSDSVTLEPVEFSGRAARKYFDRAAALGGEERTNVYSPDDTASVVYKVMIPYGVKEKVKVSLTDEYEDCCDVETLGSRLVAEGVPSDMLEYAPVLTVAGELAERESILKPIDEYKAYTRDIPLRKMKDALFVHFPISQSVLDDSFRDNRETLARIVEIMNRIERDSMSDVVKIVVIGLASPDGPVEFNEQLSVKRAEALRDYMLRKAPFKPASAYETIGAGEAWADLKDVVIESDLQDKEGLLRMLDGTDDLNERERLLRQHNGGKSYRWLKQSSFEDQRNSGYIQVYYEDVPDEGAEVINEAVAALRNNDAAKTVSLLENLDDDRKWNTLGVAYYMQGRSTEALKCFERAVKAGDEEAAKNLNLLNIK